MGRRKLIFITGVIGAGKSTIARSLPSSYYIPGDHIQGMIAKRAFPFIRESHIWNWNIMDSHLDGFMHTGTLFHMVVRSACHDLNSWKGDIVVEASVLWQRWFRTMLASTIREITGMAEDTSEFYLNYLPDAAIVCEQIKQRRRNGDERLHDLNEVKRDLVSAQERAPAPFWEIYHDEKSIRSRLNAILAPQEAPERK